MSIENDYSVKTPEENTTELLTYINNYCISHNILNTEKEIVKLDANFASPIYLMLCGCGYLLSIVQRAIFNVSMFSSIASCGDKQLLNLAEIAGVRRSEASPTTIKCVVYSDLFYTEPITITKADTVTVLYQDQKLLFRPSYDVTISEPGASAVMLLECTEDGSYFLSGGSVTAFDKEVSGVKSIFSEPSVPGNDVESIPQLRTRLLSRQTEYSFIDKATQAINGLSGISACNICYNFSFTDDLTMGDITLEPRKALVMVQGHNDKIAETYLKYMTADTASTPDGFQQVYTLLNGQERTISYMLPSTLRVKVRIYTSITYSEIDQKDISQIVERLNLDLNVATTLTALNVTDIIPDDYKVIGVELSLDDVDWDFMVNPNPMQILNISSQDISYIVRDI